MANLRYFTTLRKVVFLYVAMQSWVKFNENKAPESCCEGEVKLKLYGAFVNLHKAR